MNHKTIFYIVNVDWFFLSHRLEIALRMKDAGYRVFILAKNTGRQDEIEGFGLNFINIDFDRAGKNPIKELYTIFRISYFFKRFKPSLVHNVTIKPSIYGSIASKLYSTSNLKVINAISGLGYNFIGDRKGIVQKVLGKLMNIAFYKGVNFIFQNPDDMALYENLGFLKYNQFKIIKGAGVDSKKFLYHEPVTKNKLHVVLTSRMLKDKGVLEFVEAAKILEHRWRGKAIFRLVGDLDSSNPAGLKIEELEALQLPNYIIWEGFKKDVKSILIDADIVCLPSYREGLPKSLIEAMAIGRPIVTTDVPGCRECVENCYNGILVPSRSSNALAEAINLLLVDSNLRIKMGKNSKIKMENELSLDNVINETLAFYNEVKV